MLRVLHLVKCEKSGFGPKQKYSTGEFPPVVFLVPWDKYLILINDFFYDVFAHREDRCHCLVFNRSAVEQDGKCDAPMVAVCDRISAILACRVPPDRYFIELVIIEVSGDVCRLP